MATKSSKTQARRGAAEDGQVTITLAHPISPAYHTGLGLEPRDEDYRVGEEISVSRGTARSIINAGYAQVDPENPGEVAKALGVDEDTARRVVSGAVGGGDPAVEPGAASS